MSLFVVDEYLCVSCGDCVADCPLGLIKLADDEDFPVQIENAEKLCINCGHCMSVCEPGALSLVAMPREECRVIDWDMAPSLEQMETIVQSRRSMRVYNEKKVPEKLIARIIDTARYAPTGSNRQMLDWLVISGREKLDILVRHVIDWAADLVEKQQPLAESLRVQRLIDAHNAGDDPILRNAPVLVLIHAPGKYAGAGGLVDATIALTTSELVSFAAGLGTCWAGYFNIAAASWPPLQHALALADGHVCCGAMMLGYPDVRYKLVPQRKEARVTFR